MYKFLWLVFFATSLLAFEPVQTSLKEVDGNFAYIDDDERFVLGSSGVVLQRYKDYESIIARVSVVEKDGTKAKLAFHKFDMLEQKALPDLEAVPKVGDEVRMNFLYSRALLVTPNAEIYEFITQNRREFDYINVDIFAAYMIENYLLSPDRSDFKDFCAKNAVGILGVALQDKVKFLDCQDFSLLFEESLSSSSQIAQTPFYSRVSGYKSNFFDIFEHSVKNYYEYYENLTR